jgi:HEAT repeat protein
VLESIAVAFSHFRDSKTIPALHGLRKQDVAVQTLIELSADESADVRDWATFGLAVQTERDDPDVRAALLARMNDPDDVTREEAIRGLAI